MPRKPRLVVPGQPQHIIVRGINRTAIFYDEFDYRYYLYRLNEALERHGCALHAYVLMNNHVHLLLTPSNNQSISKSMQLLGRYYVQYFNQTYTRTGTLWEGRYKSTLVDSEVYLLTCYRYIELNPVRANLVAHPSEYPWSSYRSNGIGQPNPLITAHDQYRELGSKHEERQQAYRALCEIQIDEMHLQEIRLATNREWVLGSDYFKAKIEKKLNRRTSPLPRGGDRKSIKFRT